VPLPGNIIRVAGIVTGPANGLVTVDVFANFNDVPLDIIQGRFYLGSVTVKLNANGQAKFVFTGNNPPPGAQSYTATATNGVGSTSRFAVGILSFPLGVP